MTSDRRRRLIIAALALIVLAIGALWSIVHLQWQLAPLGWVVSVAPLVAYVGMRWTQGFDQAISWGLFAAVGVAATLAWEMAMQGSMCREILEHVIGMQSVTSIT